MPESKTLDDRTTLFLCLCSSVGCGITQSVSHESLAEPGNVVQGAWIPRALYYRHQKLDKHLLDMASEVDNIQAMGSAVIMRTLSWSSSITANQLVLDVPDDVGDGGRQNELQEEEPVGDARNAVDPDQNSLVGDMTVHLEQATADLDHIFTTVNQHILSFSTRRPLIFQPAPDAASSVVHFRDLAPPSKPNTGLLRLKLRESCNDTILSHEIHMTNALVSLSSFSDVDVPEFAATYAKVVQRVREEILRIFEIKATEWNRQLHYIQQRIPDPIQHYEEKIVDTGMSQCCQLSNWESD